MRVSLLAVLVAATGLADPFVKWKTTLGVNGRDRIVAAAADRDGNILVTGETPSRAFPASGFQKRPGGSSFLKDGVPQDIPLDGEVFKILADRRAPSKIYAATDLGMMKSIDSGATWQAIYSGAAEDFIIDAGNSEIVYRTAALELMRSDDGGATWRNISPGYSGYLASKSFLQIDPFRPGTIYWNGLYKSGDRGATWSRLDAPLGHFIFDPFRKDMMYRAEFDAVEQSIDGGANWTTIDARNVAEGVTRFVAADPLHPGILYSIRIKDCATPPSPDLNRPGLDFVNCAKSSLYRREGYGGRWLPVDVPGFFTSVWFQPGITAMYTYNGYSIIRSVDGFDTWQGFERMHRRRVNTLAFNASGQALAGISNSTDVFVAKLDPQGRLLWSTYLGGEDYDVPTAIAAGPDGSVHITGVTYSQSFLGNTIPQDRRAWFVVKLAQDGGRLIYSRVLAEAGSTPTSMAVDSRGAAYIAGITTGDFPVTAGAFQQLFRTNYRPVQVSADTNAFAMKLSESGDLVYATYLGDDGDAAGSIAVDEDGSAYVSGTAVWKLTASGGGLDFFYPMRAAYIAAAALDSRRNLFGIAQTYDDRFTTTAALAPARSGVVKHLLTRLSPDQRQLLSSTLLFDDGSFEGGSVIATPGGPVIAGSTTSFGVPTRAVIRGPGPGANGFVMALTPDAGSLRYSTYLDMQVVGAVTARDGNPVVIGLPSAVAKIEEADGGAVRIDRVLNAASFLASPYVAGMKLTVEAAGIAGLTPTVYVNGSRVASATAGNSRVTFQAPAVKGIAVLQIEAGGALSRELPLTAAASSPAIYSRDAEGMGQAWVFNEDGGVNTPKRPAAPGSVIAIAANGLNPGVLPRVWVNNLPASVVDFGRGAVAGLPGLNDIIQVQLPQPLDSGRAELRIADESVLYPPAARVYVMVE